MLRLTQRERRLNEQARAAKDAGDQAEHDRLRKDMLLSQARRWERERGGPRDRRPRS